MGAIDTLTATIMQPVAEQLGYYAGELTGYNEALRNDQLKQQKALTDIQQEANFASMEKAQQLQKDMFEYTSPAKRVQQLKEAGLNPALMYGMGGQGGSTTGNATGMAVSGGQAASDAQRKEANMQAQGMALQLAKLNSEIDVNKSIAEVNRAEVDRKGADTNLIYQSIKESQTRINNIIQDTQNKRIQSKLMELQSDYQEIVNSFQSELTETQINNMISNINYMNQDTERLILNNEVTRRSKEELIKNNILQNANLGVEILKKNKEIEGISAKISEIEQNILLMKSATNLNDVKTAGEKIMNAINDVERINTEGSGMTKESGLFAPLVNGMRAGVTAIGKLLN